MPEEPRIRLAAVPHVGRTLTLFWLLYSIFNVSFQVACLRSSGEPVPYERLTLVTLTSSVLWAGVTWLLFVACDFAFSRRRKLVRRMLLVAAALGAWLLRVALYAAMWSLTHWKFEAAAIVRATLSALFGYAMFAIVLTGLVSGMYWWQREVEMARLRAESEETLVRTELRVLADQLEPHFLLNTLTSISALSASDPAAAREMLAGLRELLAYSIRHGAAGTVTLGDEVQFIRQYLRLQSLRFGPRLRTRVTIPADLEACLVPRLLLQPLVENAVKYGDGEVGVEAERGPGTLTLRVRNSCADGPAAAGFGIGMACVRARLALLFDGEQHVSMSEEDGVVVVSVTMPLTRTRREVAA